jgi:hypothetical protein
VALHHCIANDQKLSAKKTYHTIIFIIFSSEHG